MLFPIYTMFWGLAFFCFGKDFLTSIPPPLSASLFSLLGTTILCMAKPAFGWICLGRPLKISCGPQTVPQLKMVCQHVKIPKESRWEQCIRRSWLINTISLVWQYFVRTWNEIRWENRCWNEQYENLVMISMLLLLTSRAPRYPSPPKQSVSFCLEHHCNLC